MTLLSLRKRLVTKMYVYNDYTTYHKDEIVECILVLTYHKNKHLCWLLPMPSYEHLT